MVRVVCYADDRQMTASAKSLLKHTRVDKVIYWTNKPFNAPLDVQEFHPSFTRNLDISPYSLARLLLPTLPFARVLWLDTDTIIERDIGELFDMDLHGNYLAMVEEPVRSQYPFRYFNAGVMLMDLDALRRERMMDKWLYLIEREDYTAQEQDVINLTCQGFIHPLPPEYNDADFITQHTERPYIRHYAGCLKAGLAAEIARYDKEPWDGVLQDP